MKMKKAQYLRADQLNRELRLLLAAAERSPHRAGEYAAVLNETLKAIKAHAKTKE